MSARTKWWHCGQCGFANHPRDPRLYQGNQEINESCEQCGAPRAADEATDYEPKGA